MLDTLQGADLRNANLNNIKLAKDQAEELINNLQKKIRKRRIWLMNHSSKCECLRCYGILKKERKEGNNYEKNY